MSLGFRVGALGLEVLGTLHVENLSLQAAIRE